MAKKKKAVAGRGRKKCGACSEYCGVRCKVCPHCEKPFPAPNGGGSTKTKSNGGSGDFQATLEARKATLQEQHSKIQGLLKGGLQKALKRVEAEIKSIDTLLEQQDDQLNLPF